MSHQTQIARIDGPWRAFVERWPSPTALAGAGTGDLLTAWAGLGYNRRALALRVAARQIVEQHAGAVPSEIGALERLRGVGPYTARALAATVFGQRVAPLDVNVRRVVERLLGSGPDAAGTDLQARADELVFAEDPRSWVHAVMDLAADTCTRRAPACVRCPIAGWCQSRDIAADAGSGRIAGSRTGGATRFESTNRWLRGRIIATLREAGTGEWIEFDDRIGNHTIEAVRHALAGLAAHGFLELDGCRARLV